MAKEVVTVGGFEIPYAVYTQGPECLICVNGMQQTMASWRPVVRRLSAAGRYRVVLFDFPYQGRARAIDSAQPVTLAEQVAVLHRVVEAAAPFQSVALIGGSWGAVVAAAYAAEHPSRVTKLLLGSFQPRANRRLRDVARRGQALVEQGRIDELAGLFITEFGQGMPPDRQRALQAQFRTLRSDQVLQMYRQGSVLAEATALADLVDLRAIRAETLVVNGTDDPLVDAADPAIRQIPSAELCVVPGAGHFLHLERPEMIDVYNEFFHRSAPALSSAPERPIEAGALSSCTE